MSRLASKVSLNCLHSMKLTFVVKFLIREYRVTFAETARYYPYSARKTYVKNDS